MGGLSNGKNGGGGGGDLSINNIIIIHNKHFKILALHWHWKRGWSESCQDLLMEGFNLTRIVPPMKVVISSRNFR